MSKAKKLKKGLTKVKCHCGKLVFIIEAPANAEAQIDFWCSDPCYHDWATGGM